MSQSAWADLPPSVCVMINSDDCVNYESLDPNPEVRGDQDGGQLRIKGDSSSSSRNKPGLLDEKKESSDEKKISDDSEESEKKSDKTEKMSDAKRWPINLNPEERYGKDAGCKGGPVSWASTVANGVCTGFLGNPRAVDGYAHGFVTKADDIGGLNGVNGVIGQATFRCENGQWQIQKQPSFCNR